MSDDPSREELATATLDLALARTCKVVHKEAMKVFYKENTFQFKLGFDTRFVGHRWLQPWELTAQYRMEDFIHLPIIQHLVLRADFCDETLAKTIRLVRSYSCHFKTLEVGFLYGYYAGENDLHVAQRELLKFDVSKPVYLWTLCTVPSTLNLPAMEAFAENMRAKKDGTCTSEYLPPRQYPLQGNKVFVDTCSDLDRLHGRIDWILRP